ncbi:MAG: PEGA domain-containing protein [Polyangiaceae bacterium]|nr:PEGA domain-containing protein [Polyangiaceae bacterium]
MLTCFRRSLVLLWFALLAIGITTARRTYAQDDATTETARQRFQEGVKAFDAGQFSKARVAFAQAYALKPHPAVLLNLAQSEVRVPGHEASAAEHFTQYLGEVSDSGKREEAEQGLANAKKKIATVTVTADRSGASVAVNGEDRGKTPLSSPLFLKPASYTIEARSRDDTKSEEIEATAGMEKELAFAFDEASEEGTTAAPAAAEEKAAEAPRKERKERPEKEKKEKKEKEASVSTDGRQAFFPWMVHKPIGIVLGALTLGGLGAGTALQIVAQSEYSEAKDIEEEIIARAVARGDTPDRTGQAICGDQASVGPVEGYYDACNAYLSTHDRGNNLFVGSIIGFGVGGVAAAGLVTYYFIDTAPGRKSSRHAPIHVAPFVARDGSGILVRGSF